jgi:hypothetical protein
MTPLLFLALDCEHTAAAPARWSLARMDSVLLRRGDRQRAARQERTLRIELGDPRMSANHARLIRIGERWIVEDCGSKNGTIVNGRPLVRAALSDGDLIEVGRLLLVYREVEDDEVADLERKKLAREPAAFTLSVALERLLAKLAELARTRGPVALQVAPGTDGIQIARAAFDKKRSKLLVRRAEPGALDGLPQSGTVVLEHAGALSAAIRRQVARLGRTQPSLRLVTVGPPGGAPFRGRSVTIPPLRDRREDVGWLSARVLARADADYDWAIDPEAARSLFRHDWPGNERELETTLEAAAARSGDGQIRLEHLPDLAVSTLAEAPDEAARDELSLLLARHRGNLSAVARELERDRASLARQLRRLGIDPRAYR